MQAEQPIHREAVSLYLPFEAENRFPYHLPYHRLIIIGLCPGNRHLNAMRRCIIVVIIPP